MAAESPKCPAKAFSGPESCLLSPKPAVEAEPGTGWPFPVTPLQHYEMALPGTVPSCWSFTAEACWKLTNNCLDLDYF